MFFVAFRHLCQHVFGRAEAHTFSGNLRRQAENAIGGAPSCGLDRRHGLVGIRTLVERIVHQLSGREGLVVEIFSPGMEGGPYKASVFVLIEDRKHLIYLTIAP